MFDNEQFFFGEHPYSLDNQRRVAIPKDWRKKGTDTRFILLPGRESLLMIPYESFKEFFAKVKKVSFANRKAQMALAKIGARVQECACDKQGRIKIAQHLLEPFGISDQILMVGSFTNIQLWNPEKWEEQKDEDDNYLDELEKISENPDGFFEMFQESIKKIKD